MFRKIPFAAALMGLTLTAAPAFADTLAVRYKDLDLTTAEGQKTLDRRIDAAARQVCGYDEVITGTRLRSRDSVACYKQARAQVQKQVASAAGNPATPPMGG